MSKPRMVSIFLGIVAITWGFLINESVVIVPAIPATLLVLLAGHLGNYTGRVRGSGVFLASHVNKKTPGFFFEILGFLIYGFCFYFLILKTFHT